VTPPAGTLRRAWLVVPDRVAGRVDLEALAREAGVHPEHIRRLVALGLLDPVSGTPATRMLFPRDAAAQIARVERLRRDLGLNYAGAILASSLLDRIEQLERRLRAYESADRPRQDRPRQERPRR
jgi:hypothetical protein